MSSTTAGTLLEHIRHAAGVDGRTDRELLRCFHADRDETAFAELMRRHAPFIWGVCRRSLAREPDVEDAFQATFILLARKAGFIQDTEAVGGWLYGVACRIAMTMKRGHTRRKRHERNAAAASPPGPAGESALRELRALLDEEVGRLPAKFRTPFVLCCLEGRSRAETAGELGWKEGTVSSRIAEARRLLQKRLAGRGVTLSAGLTAGVIWAEPAPAALVQPTLQAALRIAAGQTLRRAVAPSVAALVEAALRTATGANSVLFVLGLLSAALIAGLGFTLAQTPRNDPGPQIQQAAAELPGPKTDLQGDPLPANAIARLGTIRLRHGGSIGFLQFTPDGKLLIARGTDGLRTWDTATGKAVGLLRPDSGHSFDNQYSISPDGRRLAVPGKTGAEIWDLGSAQKVGNIGTGELFSVCFSADGKLLASESTPRQNQLAVWDIATGQLVRSWGSLLPYPWSYAQLGFAPDNQTLIAGGLNNNPNPYQKRVRTYDIVTGTERQIDLGDANVVSFAPSPDGRSLAILCANEQDWVDRHVRLLDLRTGRERHRLTTSKRIKNRLTFTALAFAPDGKTLFTGGVDDVLIAWDPATGKERRRLAQGVRSPFALAVSADGRTIAATVPSTAIRLIDAATGSDRSPAVGHEMRLNVVQLSPDGGTAVTASAGRMTFWDVATGRERRRIDQLEPMIGLSRLMIDSRTLLTQERDESRQVETLREWDFATGSERSRADWKSAPENWSGLLALAPDGKTAAFTGWHQDITIRARKTGELLTRMEPPGVKAVHGAAFTPDGRTLISWVGDKTSQVLFWDPATGRLQRQLSFPDAPEYWRGRPIAVDDDDDGSFELDAAVSPDGRLIACGNRRQESLAVYDLASGRIIHKKAQLGIRPTHLAFSPDSRVLAWGGDAGDAAVHLLEVTTGGERCRFAGHTGAISSLAFSRDGPLLLSGSNDTTALVWDVTDHTTAKAPELTPVGMDAAWDDLNRDDAARAYQAMRKLMHSPAGAVDLLAKRLPPASAPDPKRLATLIADLDAEEFAIRDAATKELSRLGVFAEPALRRALEPQPTPEVLRRIDELLGGLRGIVLTGEALRQARAVEILEQARTAPARRLLEKLAAGAPGARLSREATAALQRLRTEGRQD